MRGLLGLLVLLFNLTDNTTTFLCLRAPVNGFDVIEANPFARWLFDAVGLAQGLMIETVLTTAAVGFLVFSPRISPRVRMAVLVVLTVLPAWATLNNLQVMRAIGL
jgi:hypothetical protein